MGCVQSYFKRAHNAGISPSSTQESNSKQPGSEDGASSRPNEERSIAEEPESNDTSHGVEATAVRTLAATTGTVAILGTTAKTAGADTIHEEQEAERDTKEDAEPATGAGAAEPSPPPTAERITPSETKVEAKSPVSDTNKSEISSPEAKSSALPVVESPTKTAEEISEVVSESKDKDEDLSSERLKTNSISNTTLSSDSILEIDNNSVKQSPSTDKVIESFDSSSTVEFVDSAVKDLAKNVKSNPVRSISSELSNKALPVDGDKTPDVLSPVETQDIIENEDLPPPPPPEALHEIDSERPSVNEKQETGGAVLNEPSEIETEESNSSSKEPLNDESSIHSEISSNVSSSVQSVIRVDTGNQDVNSRGAIEHSPNASDDNHKAETGSPFSSENNSPLNGNGDIPSPVTAVVVSPVDSNKEIEQIKVNSTSPGKEETVVTNGISSKTETPNITPASSPTDTSKFNSIKVNGNHEHNLNNSLESKLNGGVSLEMPEISDKNVIAAATTIQASYRGFQERRNLKLEKNEEVAKSESLSNDSEEPIEIVKDPIDRPAAECNSTLDEVDDKMITAATTIQANFRGFQTRLNLKNKTDSGLPPSEETNLSEERRTPTALTPELIDSVKEEVEEICKEAESIVAERSESADWVKGVQQVVVGSKLPASSVSESIQAMRGSTTPPEVSEADDTREEVFEEADDKTVQAATTIQASFRGFQARKTLQGNQDRRDSMPNYPPPPADEELPSLDDLPPPDFDALESSYSEDVPTEPLAPPPDSLVFNEEDEDELMSLQHLQRPQECDELPEHRLTLTDSSDSSLSSAATKIQAGVRGYLTRKQIQGQGGTGTTSTSTGVLDSVSDRSQSLEDAARSPEQESEVCRHRASPEPPPRARGPRAGGKRMSLAEPAPTRTRPPLRTALSVQGGGPTVSDDDVWSTLKNELSDAATLIQSNFRGYRTRKQLQREDAVQVTSGSSQTPSSGSAEAGRGSAASGEDKPGSRQEDEPSSKREDKPGSKQEDKPGSKQEDKPGSKKEDKSGSKQEDRHGSKQEGKSDSKQDDEATARCSGEYHDIIALSPPVTVNKEGGGAQAHGGGAVAGSPHDETDAMVKRRADDPEATAATKIQATFRGFKARQGMREEDRAAAKIQAGFRGYKVRKEMKSERARQGGGGQPASGAATAAGDEETTARAATKIQAGVRGFLVRRRNRKDRPKPDDQ